MKALAWIIGIVVLLVVGGVAFVLFNSGSFIKTAMEELGPDYLGTSVDVGSVDLSLASGSAEVKGLNIGNPAGFTGGHLMKVNTIGVTLDPNQISEQLIVISEVIIDGADIAAIAQGKKTNFEKIMQNLQNSAGGDSGQASTSTQPEPKFVVKKFDFTNAKASLSSDILGDLQLDIPDIHLRDVGAKSNGATAAELAEALLKPISSAVTKAIVNEGLDLDSVRAGVEKRIGDKLEEKLGTGLRGLTDRFKK